jgi:hypothetical protein
MAKEWWENDPVATAAKGDQWWANDPVVGKSEATNALKDGAALLAAGAANTRGTASAASAAIRCSGAARERAART